MIQLRGIVQSLKGWLGRPAAAPDTDPYRFLAALQWLPNPDPILRREGYAEDVYASILADAHVIGELRSIRGSFRAHEYRIVPGTEGDAKSEAARDLCVKWITSGPPNAVADWLEVMWQMSASIFTGYRAHEMVWELSDGLYLPSAVIDRPNRRFRFDHDGAPLLVSRDNRQGAPVEPYQFVISRHMPTSDNPYGQALLSSCFWPWTFKTGGWRYFVKFCERHGLPWPVGRYPQGSDDKEIDKLESALAGMIEAGYVVAQEGTGLELLVPTGGGGALPQERLIVLANREMSKALTSQAMIGEQLDVGSRAAADTAKERQDEVHDSDRDIAAAGMSQIFRWITLFNFGDGIAPPRLEFYRQTAAGKDRAETYRIAAALGARPSRKWFTWAKWLRRKDDGWMVSTTSSVGLRFEEAVNYLKAKLPEASIAWDSLAGPVHGKVFTVAGGIKTDLVDALHGAISKALHNGTTITEFRKDFDQAVQDHGWTYRGKRGWRTAVIFDTNMRSAHMAGRWAQLQAGKARRPFLQYRTAGDARVRPQHRAWNGLIYPVDDAFWQTHYPPNGWGCRCTVRAYSQADMDAKGLQAASPFEVKTREVITRDGEIKDRVPVGIDPGWDHNVGTSWLSPELALGRKLASLPRPLQGIVTDKTITPAFQQVLNGNFKAFRTAVRAASKPEGAAQIVGWLDSATLNALAEAAPDLALESTAVAVLDRKTLHLEGGHKAATKPQQLWNDEQIDALPEALRNYRAVLWDEKNSTLIVVPQGKTPGSAGDLVAKMALRPNVRSKQGTALSVVSLGSSPAADLLKSGQYTLLVGKL